MRGGASRTRSRRRVAGAAGLFRLREGFGDRAGAADGGGAGRHTTSSLPMCCTGAARSSAQMRASSPSRAPWSALNTRTLMSSCASRLTSISCSTLAVRPCWPTRTTGCSRCALARSARRSAGVSESMARGGQCRAGASPERPSGALSCLLARALCAAGLDRGRRCLVVRPKIAAERLQQTDREGPAFPATDCECDRTWCHGNAHPVGARDIVPPLKADA